MKNKQTKKITKIQMKAYKYFWFIYSVQGQMKAPKKPSANRLGADYLSVQTSHFEQGWTH